MRLPGGHPLLLSEAGLETGENLLAHLDIKVIKVNVAGLSAWRLLFDQCFLYHLHLRGLGHASFLSAGPRATVFLPEFWVLSFF
jgi:hypothetical protein